MKIQWMITRSSRLTDWNMKARARLMGRRLVLKDILFFGILKQEMYYGEKLTTYEELKHKIEEYIYYYNNKLKYKKKNDNNKYTNKPIKTKFNSLSPVKYRNETILTAAYINLKHCRVTTDGVVCITIPLLYKLNLHIGDDSLGNFSNRFD